MAFEVHQINYQSYCANPALRDPNPTVFSTLALAYAFQQSLGGNSDSINGTFWNSCIFNQKYPEHPTIPFDAEYDD